MDQTSMEFILASLREAGETVSEEDPGTLLDKLTVSAEIRPKKSN